MCETQLQKCKAHTCSLKQQEKVRVHKIRLGIMPCNRLARIKEASARWENCVTYQTAKGIYLQGHGYMCDNYLTIQRSTIRNSSSFSLPSLVADKKAFAQTVSVDT